MPDSRVEPAIHHWAARFVSNGVPLRIVPWQAGEKLAQAAKGAVEFVLLDDGNHVANNRIYRYRLLSADWMARQLGVQ